ncbi:MAG: Hpt domain-containing protein [bacterium]|nr:Hpt domain-containing protein [bacterium]
MINYDYLSEIAGGDEEFIAEILGDFLAQTPELLTQIEMAVAGADAGALGAAAHTLKGSARSVGADGFAEIAYELEQAGKSGDLTRAPEALQRLQTYWRDLADYLQQRAA